MLAVHEDGLAQIIDGCLAAKLERGRVEGIAFRNQPHHGGGEKIEDIGTERGVDELRTFHRNQLTGANSLLRHGDHLVSHGPEEPFDQWAHGVRLALAEADHLLLHEGLEDGLGVDAVKVVERRADQPLASRAVQGEYGHAGAGHARGHGFDGRGVEGLLALEVIVDKGLVDAGGFGNGLCAGAGQAIGAELAGRGFENAGAGLVGAFGLGAGWGGVCHVLTN